jgi:hypothetical protein
VLAPGQTLAVPDRVAVLGRGEAADVVLPDPTISRRHARLRVIPGQGVEVERISTSNGLFIDGEAVGDRGLLAHPTTPLQLGGVILRVSVRPDLRDAVADVDTRPVTTPLVAEARSRWTVVWDAGACSVALEGTLLELPPVPTKVLATLLEHAPEVVHRWDLLDRVGPTTNLAQAVSLARTAIRSRLTQALREDLARAVRERLGEAPADDDALLRRVIANRRGHGYLICVAAEDVTVEQR